MRLILLLLLMSFSTFAQDCKEVAISTENFPKNNNQSDTNWCSFWSTAELLSFHEGIPLSSYDMGFQYFNNDLVRDPMNYDNTQTGANLPLALILSKGSTKGICLESQTNFTNDDWMNLGVMFVKLSHPKKNLISIICENNFQHSTPFKNIPYDILKVIDKLSADKKSAALLDVTCGQRYQMKNKYGVGTRAIENFPPEKIIEKLDQVLSAKQPAAISFDYNMLKNPAEYTKQHSNHTSTIIGRRANPVNGVCEYLLRDTFGNACLKNSIYECDKTKGTIWVPRENIEKNIYEVNWLVKAKN